MDQPMMMVAIAGVVLVLGYLVVMRVFYKDSKQLDSKVDLRKMKVWKDED